MLAALAASCVTDGQRDIGGRSIQVGDFKEIDRSESRVTFSGDAAPKVMRTEVAWRDNSMRVEQLLIGGERGADGFVKVEFAAGSFDDQTTDYLKDPANVEAFAKRYCRYPPVPARVEKNRSGDFLYSTCRFQASGSCLYAIQGFGWTPRGGQGAHGSGFKAVADFRYCSPAENEDDILGRLAALRVLD